MSVMACGSVIVVLLCVMASDLISDCLLFVNALVRDQILLSGVNLLNWLMCSCQASRLACSMVFLQ